MDDLIFKFTQPTILEKKLISAPYKARGFEVKFDENYVYISKKGILIERNNIIFYLQYIRQN
jgi:hypothetical protein